MKYLKSFINQTKYQEYISADDIWLPRVSFIKNGGPSVTTGNKYSDTGPSRVEYSRIGTEFIQVANDGVMYFTDQIYKNESGQDVKYSAEISGDAIVIRTENLVTNELTNDAYIDETNEQIVINYPTGQTATFALP